ncbi:MAG: cupin domain-containing protein [Planctomycetales bacterium]|nr:cupin domain-containing protein [Planctomycetales bacterium]
MNEKKAFVVEVNSEKGYQRLISGAPVTHGMKVGRVYLEPGAECGVHSTEDKEETLVFLAGKGIALAAGEKLAVGKGKVCYIPPRTEHNILNTSDEPLVYIFCVAPAGR